MADDKRNYSNHKIIIDERESITINGVTEVLSFDEEVLQYVRRSGSGRLFFPEPISEGVLSHAR